MSCDAFEWFIDNVHWLHFIDSTVTASTNISNYFCALWPKRRVELFTNVVEIPQSSPRRFFISYFRWLLLLLFGRLQSPLVVNWPIYSSGLRNFSQGFSSRRLQISISQINSVFLFRKLQIFISFRFVSKITVSPSHHKRPKLTFQEKANDLFMNASRVV